MIKTPTGTVGVWRLGGRRTAEVMTDETGRTSSSAASPAGYDRIITTLDRLACERHGGGWGVRELAEALEESRTSVNRALMVLSDVGLAERTDAGNYRAGPRLRVLADRVLSEHPLLAAAPAVLAELSARTEATAIVAVHDWPLPRSFVAVYHAGSGPVRYNLDPGTMLPLHAGAAGQAILSEVGIKALRSDLAAFTSNTIVDTAQLAEVIAQTRERGFALSVGQHFPLAAGVAVPMRTQGLVAAISVTRPRYSTTEADLLDFAPLVAQARQELLAAVRNTGVSTRPGFADSLGAERHPGSGAAPARLERLLAALAATPAGLASGGRSLGRAIGANRATATKIMDSATRCGLTVDTGDRFLLGPRLLHWAAALGPISARVDVLAAFVQAAAIDTGEAVGLAEYHSDRGTATMSLVATGSTPLQYGLATGVDMPLHAGAAGKAILAHLPVSVLETLTLDPFTENTITSKSVLAEQLPLIRAQGFAIGDGERIPDAFGIAVPYFVDGAVAGSLTATMPRFRASHIDTDRIATALVQSAQRITQLLSVTTDSPPASDASALPSG